MQGTALDLSQSRPVFLTSSSSQTKLRDAPGTERGRKAGHHSTRGGFLTEWSKMAALAMPPATGGARRGASCSGDVRVTC